jgi:hypothetical protein
MLFNVEEDRGDTIVAYLVPDNASETPRLVALSGGVALWEGPANEDRPALVAAGRHRTGRCGFRIGPAEIPDLALLADLVLADAASGLAIWRRGADAPRVPRRLFRLETGLAPMTGFDLAMEGLFRAWHVNIDRLGHETASQTFLLHGVDSVYLSGRLLLPGYAYLLDRGFEALAALRDPYVELAERAAILSGARGPLGLWLSERDRMTLGPAIEALAGLDPADPEALRRRFRRLDRAAGAALSNPLGRQLTTTRPDELCGGDAAAAGLRALAGFAVVGADEAEGFFEQAVADLIGAGPLPGRGDPHAGETLAIAATLAEVPAVEALLEIDLEIYDAVVPLLPGVAAAG